MHDITIIVFNAIEHNTGHIVLYCRELGDSVFM